MKVTIAAVVSLDGKLTRHGEDDVHLWASSEDHRHFRSLVESHNAIVIGSTVYELMRDNLDHIPGRTRIVLTSRPDDYAGQAIKGQLEFMTKTPSELTALLEKRGHKNLLIAGGPRMMTEFLQAKLVDEIYLTLEPRIFGGGHNLINNELLDVKLKLIEQRQLNDNGSLLLHYKVKN